MRNLLHFSYAWKKLLTNIDKIIYDCFDPDDVESLYIDFHYLCDEQKKSLLTLYFLYSDQKDKKDKLKSYEENVNKLILMIDNRSKFIEEQFLDEMSCRKNFNERTKKVEWNTLNHGEDL